MDRYSSEMTVDQFVGVMIRQLDVFRCVDSVASPSDRERYRTFADWERRFSRCLDLAIEDK